MYTWRNISAHSFTCYHNISLISSIKSLTGTIKDKYLQNIS